MRNEPGTDKLLKPSSIDYIHERDELRFRDMWTTLAKRRLLFILIVLVSLLCGAILYFLSDEKYTVTTTIEIGSWIEGSQRLRVQDPNAVQAILRNTHIPAGIDFFMKQADGKVGFLRVNVKTPRNKDLVSLMSVTTKELYPLYKKLHEHIQELLVKQHQIQQTSKKELVKLKLVTMENLLQNLRNNANYINHTIEYYKSTEKDLLNKMVRIENHLKEYIQSRENIVDKMQKSSNSLNTLILDNQIENIRTRLDQINNQYKNLPLKFIELEGKLEKNSREQSRTSIEADIVRQQLKYFQMTKSQYIADISHTPIWPKASKILIISLMSGIILAIFIIYITEALNRRNINNHNDELDV